MLFSKTNINSQLYLRVEILGVTFCPLQLYCIRNTHVYMLSLRVIDIVIMLIIMLYLLSYNLDYNYPTVNLLVYYVVCILHFTLKNELFNICMLC